MSPAIIFYGFLVFSLFLCIHVFIWRIKISRISSLVVLIIFIVVPSALYAVLLGLGMAMPMKLNAVQLSEVYVLHLSLSAVYIASYPAVRAISPTLEIILMITAAPDGKMTEESIVNRFATTTLVKARIDDLMIYRLIVERNGRIELTGLARLITRCFVLFRKALGLPVGRG